LELLELFELELLDVLEFELLELFELELPDVFEFELLDAFELVLRELFELLLLLCATFMPTALAILAGFISPRGMAAVAPEAARAVAARMVTLYFMTILLSNVPAKWG
jgi:hypothetical protein